MTDWRNLKRFYNEATAIAGRRIYRRLGRKARKNSGQTKLGGAVRSDR